MVNVKKLQMRLSGRCENFGDATVAECKEYDVDPKLLKTTFLRHEINEENNTVTYFYQCDLCGLEESRTRHMEDDYLLIGNCPYEEEDKSFKLYTTSYLARALRIQLRNTFGKEPEGATLVIKYDWGEDGYNVHCLFNPRYPISMAYAYMLEGNLPKRWSQVAKDTLAQMTNRPCEL